MRLLGINTGLHFIELIKRLLPLFFKGTLALKARTTFTYVYLLGIINTKFSIFSIVYFLQANCLTTMSPDAIL